MVKEALKKTKEFSDKSDLFTRQIAYPYDFEPENKKIWETVERNKKICYWILRGKMANDKAINQTNRKRENLNVKTGKVVTETFTNCNVTPSTDVFESFSEAFY